MRDSEGDKDEGGIVAGRGVESVGDVVADKIKGKKRKRKVGGEIERVALRFGAMLRNSFEVEEFT